MRRLSQVRCSGQAYVPPCTDRTPMPAQTTPRRLLADALSEAGVKPLHARLVWKYRAFPSQPPAVPNGVQTLPHPAGNFAAGAAACCSYGDELKGAPHLPDSPVRFARARRSSRAQARRCRRSGARSRPTCRRALWRFWRRALPPSPPKSSPRAPRPYSPMNPKPETARPRPCPQHSMLL